MNAHSHLLEAERHMDEQGPVVESNPGPLRVFVPLTTIEATLAALNEAAHFAKGLEVEIVLVVTDVVSFHYPLENAPVSVYFFERLCLALIDESNLDADKVNIEIYYCRDRIQCLQLILKPRSLVIIGAKKSIWKWQERKLHRALIRRGHDVILVYVTSTSLKSRSQLVIHHLLEEVSEKKSNNERRNLDYGGVPQAYVSSAAAGHYHRQAVRSSDPPHPGQHGESPLGAN